MDYIFSAPKEKVDSLKNKIDTFTKKPKLEEFSKEDIDLMIDILIKHFTLEQNAYEGEPRNDLMATLKCLNNLKKAHTAFDEFKVIEKEKKNGGSK